MKNHSYQHGKLPSLTQLGITREDLINALIDSWPCHRTDASDRAGSCMGLDEATLVRAFAIIGRNLDDLSALDSLASDLELARKKFSKKFRDSTGVTPVQLATAARLVLAKKLMVRKGDALADIAGALGFHSQTHFTKAFRNHAGLTPRQFVRRDMQGRI